ncbi:MAG: 4-(cytidine 5'-diphospho)-2-C-methyl-D-erythritol kinase [Phycisphaerae bacterium]|jgi:4-diphosphocytidyl-2-C-methyl-D-erythritol kinase|nr:4-(cytidine 5'-diphospho)-2-C-methyl-D-erythritol kinase [Phycisphaerae bacterium]
MNDHGGGNSTILPVRVRCQQLDGGALLIRAPAKINLNLLVGPRRGNGFHPVDSLVAKVTLYDEERLCPRTDGRITLTCSGADCGPQERNLVMQAARLLAEGKDIGGVDISLTKRIAPGSGLGGGSSDAASLLWGLNRLWRLGLDAPGLDELARRLGSDVPLFLGPPASRMTGRGERLATIAIHPFVAVVFVPGLTCSTAEVYAAYDRRPAQTAGQLEPHVLANQPPSAWRGYLQNDLATAAGQVCPPLLALRERLAAATDVSVCLTGSGSAMFFLCNDAAEAVAVMAGLDDDLQARCVTVQPNPW